MFLPRHYRCLQQYLRLIHRGQGYVLERRVYVSFDLGVGTFAMHHWGLKRWMGCWKDNRYVSRERCNISRDRWSDFIYNNQQPSNSLIIAPILIFWRSSQAPTPLLLFLSLDINLVMNLHIYPTVTAVDVVVCIVGRKELKKGTKGGYPSISVVETQWWWGDDPSGCSLLVEDGRYQNRGGDSHLDWMVDMMCVSSIELQIVDCSF